MKYLTMEELIGKIDRPVNRKVLELYTKYKPEMVVSQGSQHNHQAWAGGYLDHVSDTMNTARLLWTVMNEKRKLEFSLSDALVVLFFHDIEKAFPTKITEVMESSLYYTRPKAKNKVRYRFLHDESVWDLLSVSQKNALDHAEGEGDGYTNERRTMGPLAAFVHMCDVCSARIWFDHPLADRETWGWRTSEAIGDHDLWAV